MVDPLWSHRELGCARASVGASAMLASKICFNIVLFPYYFETNGGALTQAYLRPSALFQRSACFVFFDGMKIAKTMNDV
jgi:hypothetical protein